MMTRVHQRLDPGLTMLIRVIKAKHVSEFV